MFTRQDYMSNKCSHREYYAQFVTPYIKAVVLKRFPRIAESTDEHFNDTPLAHWDALSNTLKSHLALPEYGDGKKYYSLGSAVCILKEAARQIKEGR